MLSSLGVVGLARVCHEHQFIQARICEPDSELPSCGTAVRAGIRDGVLQPDAVTELPKLADGKGFVTVIGDDVQRRHTGRRGCGDARRVATASLLWAGADDCASGRSRADPTRADDAGDSRDTPP
jgi:hypothetical protein